MLLQEIANVETLGYIYEDNEASKVWLIISRYQTEQIILTSERFLLDNALTREGPN